MSNDMFGGIILGVGLAFCAVAIFQIGINIGLKTACNMLDGNYPAALNYLTKHKSSAKVLPYMIGGVE